MTKQKKPDLHRKKRLNVIFGEDEDGVCLPRRMSSSMYARVTNKGVGCDRCFPHGFEQTNSSKGKNNKSWKHQRKLRYRIKDVE